MAELTRPLTGQGPQADRRWGSAVALAALLVGGFLLRIAFIGSRGFQTDVQSFEGWAISLAQHGFGSFYSTGGFADYPPGYFYVLAAVGHIWQAFFPADHSYAVLKVLVKLPAILADLGVGALAYAIVARFSSRGVALGAAALYLLNPAVIFISSAWGQVDSVAGGFALLAVYCLLRSEDDAPDRLSWWIVGGWLAFSYSLLVKPQAAVLLPLMIAFAFVNAARRRARIQATAIGIAAGLLLAIGLSEPFHPSNPIASLLWLLGRYTYGSSVYPYNTVNAFNLWAIHGAFWQPDSTYVLLMPQVDWGILLVVAAVALVVWRYVQDPQPRALVEGSAIATIAFFMLATRMHERYLFNGMMFTIVCLPFARRYLWGAIALSVVLFANLCYSLEYLHVVSDHVAGMNASNLWGLGTSLLALLGVATFFWLGYFYLGGADEDAVAKDAMNATDTQAPSGFTPADTSSGRRRWFDPIQGLRAMQAPLDYLVMGALGVGSFVLSYVGYWWPQGSSCWAEKGLQRCGVFDEIYFARAGEEYLQNLRIYENTHPPLSKLLVTFSMMLFGGMPKGHGMGGWTFLNAIIGHMSNGDNTYGWRFLDVVFGALVVMLLYVFAKRITGSTLFAAITASFLVLDGMHFVQSRIATPEGFVIFFSTLAVYAFYRFWISSQVAERAYVRVPAWGYVAGVGASLAVGVVVATLLHGWWKLDRASTVIVTLYTACGAYLFVRYLLFSRLFGDGSREMTFAEGSRAVRSGSDVTVYAADGGTIDPRGKVQRGEISQNKGGVLTYRDDALTIAYRRDATVTYETATGTATYAQNEVRSVAGTEKGASSRLWLILFTVALGMLVSTKWYGVMGFGVSFVACIAVWLQPYVVKRRPLLWGNPRGFRLDAALVTIVFVSMTVYGLVWVPDLARHSPDPNEIHNFNDVVYRQYTMFEYHDTLKATHPYSSKWWEWPLDYVPVAYYYEDHRQNQNDPNGCCIYEITSMPNPMILWFGLLCVPWVGVLAWRERNKGYALIVLTYLLQWLPWMASPRIAFAYHFYVDIPLICLCNAVVLQRVWEWSKRQGTERARWAGGIAVGGYVLLVAASFVYFYPILAAHPITWNAWHQRMWFKTWIIGPG